MSKKQQENKKRTIQIYWPKWQKKKGIRETNKVNSSKILVSGLLITCIILSISSGFIDLTFFSGLSKSKFHIGNREISAAILYTFISIGLISMKFWCAMKIGMLRELRTRLKSQGITWWNNISKALIPWNIAHKLLIVLSLITAMSMSVNSIGAGIREIQRNVDNMSKDAQTLIALKETRNDSKQEGTKSTVEAANSKAKTNENLETEVSAAYNTLVNYQNKARDLRDDQESGKITEEEFNQKYETLAAQAVRSIPVITKKNWEYATRKDLYNGMAIKDVINVDNSAAYKEIEEYSKLQIQEEILALIEKEYRKPDGELIIFVKEDGTTIEVQTAISRLQDAISKWQNDTGDVGESSKIFSLIATYIKADEKAGGMGASEWMIMILIFVVGIIQEFAIALSTPSATISRDTLASISNYCEWKDDREKNLFLIHIYKHYVSNGVYNQQTFDAKCRKAVELMEDDISDIIDKYSKKNKQPKVVKQRLVETKQPEKEIIEKIIEKPVIIEKEKPVIIEKENSYSDEVEKKIKEIDDLLND